MFYIGIDLEKDALRVAILKNEKKTISIESLHTLPLGPDNVKLFYNLPPFHTGKETKVISGISSSDTFIRKLHIPLKEQRKILEILPFQLESLIPFSTEAPVICPLFKPLSKQMTAVTVLAISEETLTSHLKALKELDIAPDTVSCAPTALMRFGNWKLGNVKKILHFDVREGKVSCVVYEKAEILLSQVLPDCEEGNLSNELEKLSIFLKQKGVIDDTTPWLLTGEVHYTQFFDAIFSGEKLEIDEQQAAFAAAIGLALDALAEDSSSVQFCQKKFIAPHTLQRRQKNLLTYVAFCLGAAVLMAAGSSLILGKKQKALGACLQEYLLQPAGDTPFASLGDIEDKLYDWERSLAGQKNTFAYLPNVPKVSDVLAWLSVHPAFASEEGGQKSGIEIKSFHYSLTKYPKIGDPSAPYTGQVELEFSSQVPRSARDFHEALLKGDQIVNAKKDVKWQTQNQTYYTSFELNKVNSR